MPHVLILTVSLLLIAPEGIEMTTDNSINGRKKQLLIAPEGIEIPLHSCLFPRPLQLLIAPEGIEITIKIFFQNGKMAFNRTRRN